MDLATSAADMGASPPPSAGGRGVGHRRGRPETRGRSLAEGPEKAMATCRHFSVLLPTGNLLSLDPVAVQRRDDVLGLLHHGLDRRGDSAAAARRVERPSLSAQERVDLARSSHSFSSAVAFSSREHSAVTADAVTASSKPGDPRLGSARLARPTPSSSG